MGPTISSPLRLLILGAPDTPDLNIFEDKSHHEIQTPYYSASIPIWRDMLPTTPSTITSFQEEWRTPEAGEVVQAVGAWVVYFKKPKEQTDLDSIRSALCAIPEIIKHHTASSYSTNEALLLAIGTQQTISPRTEISGEEWEDICRECGGWEWIDGELEGDDGGKGKDERNEFGERMGIARLKEALEAHEWDSGADADALSDDLGIGSEDGFGAEAAQVEREMMGLKLAVHNEDGSDEGGDNSVEELENMMLKVRAIKDMGVDMPIAERKRFAAKAVNDVMKTL